MNDRCSICLRYDDLTPLSSCGHLFHTSCISQWYERSRSCPVCRGIILRRDIPRREIVIDNPNKTNITRDSLLMLAVKDNRRGIFDDLLVRGANVNHKNNFGNTALMWSSFYGRLDMVKILVERGANVDDVNNVGTTPLIWASKSGKFEIVKFLIESGADKTIVNRQGYDALKWATKRNKLGSHSRIIDILRD